MDLIIIIINFVIFLRTGLSISNDSNQINLIVDVVNSYDKPTSVIAIVCWKLKYKTNLIDGLQNVDNPKTIRFVSETVQTWESYDFASKDTVIVVDLSCHNIRSVLKKVNKEKLFRNHYRWLVVGIPTNESAIIPAALDNSIILPDSEVIIANKYAENSYELLLIYKMYPGSKWLHEYFGIWTTANGISISTDMHVSVQMRRKNLQKYPVASSFAVSDNRTKYDPFDLLNPTVDSPTKCGFHITEPMFEFLNATRVNVFADTWGYYVNGSWNGMVGNVHRGEAEFTGTVMFITKDRLQVIHYLTSPIKSNVFFVFREPPLSYQNNLFLLPFRGTVWACTAGFAGILLVALYALARWEAGKADDVVTSGDTLKANVSDVAMIIVSAISQQGSTIELKGFTGRLVTLLLLIAFLFLYTSYSASVVALLQSSSNQIRTLEDLLESKLELGVEDTPYNRYLFLTATDPIRKAIYQNKIAPRGSKPKFMSIEDGVRKLQETPFAFNMNIGDGYRIVQNYFYEHEKCGLQEISFFPNLKPWLGCKKDSPYKEMFQIGLYRIQEHGIGDRQFRLFYTKKPECIARGGSFASVSIIDVYPALLMLLYGVVFSILVLIVEILVHKRSVKQADRELTAEESSVI